MPAANQLFQLDGSCADGQSMSCALRSVRHRQTDRLFRGLPIRGVQSELEIDAEGCNGSGELFLFGSVLNEFFAQHAGINTFHALSIISLQGERYQWVPRLGHQPLF